MPLNPNKNLKLYYSIGEVADMLGVRPSVLRFWETKFDQIAPRKAARDIRQYSEKDIKLLKTIKHLVHDRGLKIESAKEILKNNREGMESASEAIARLQQVRAALVTMRRNLSLISADGDEDEV